MKDPVFPVPSALVEKACSFNDYPCGKVFELGDGIIIQDWQIKSSQRGMWISNRIRW